MAPPTSAALLGPPVAALNTNIAAAADSRDSDYSSVAPYGGVAKEASRFGRALAYALSGDPCVDFFC